MWGTDQAASVEPHGLSRLVRDIRVIETALGPFWAWLGVGEVPPAQTVIGAAIVVLAIVVNSLLGLHRWRRTRGMVAPAPEPAPEAEFSPSSARRRNRRE